MSPAFSADAPTSTTTRARIIGPQPQPSDDIDPETGLARSTVVRPLREAPAPPLAAPGALPRAAPGPTPSAALPLAMPGAPGHLALILPTASATLGPLAEAVREGFAAAVRVAGKDAPAVTLTAVDNEGGALIDACRQAQASGAILVIAAITLDGAANLAHSDCARQPVLELNEPQDIPAAELPPSLYTVSLSVEQEARQVALMAVSDGLHSAIVVSTASPLARRVEDAFDQEWSRAAGEVRPVSFSGRPEDAPLLRERLEAMKGDMVFLAMEPAAARALRPYLPPTLPLYATSLSVNPRAEAIVNLDLQGLRYVEMPWFVQPDHPAVMVYPPPPGPMTVDQERLYAFGIDAFRLAVHMLHGNARRTPLDGVTGRITIDSGNAFVRTLTPVEVDGGRVIPLRPK